MSTLVAGSDCKWVETDGSTKEDGYYVTRIGGCEKTQAGSTYRDNADICTGNVYCKHKTLGVEFWVSSVMCKKTDEAKCRFPLNCINDYYITMRRETPDGKVHLTQPRKRVTR